MVRYNDLIGNNGKESVPIFSILANQRRIDILTNLMNGEMNVGALAKKVGLSQSALSQHLSRLRAHNFVKTRREEQSIYYSLSSETTKSLVIYLLDFPDKGSYYGA